ncbi:MAG TPA: hypothetical protein VKV95_21470 [Terriglobia bacterium]|nr:hypothetical protein [Terriglobia bacterium]
MSGTVFLCQDGLPPNAGLLLPEGFQKHALSLEGPQRNINRQLDHVEAKMVEDLDPAVFDLLDIATYVYIGDTSAPRGQNDVYGNKWCRDLVFRIPVREFERWNQEEVRGRLSGLLTYLSGDARIQLEFYPHKNPSAPPKFLKFQHDMAGFQGATTVSLFSGGVDSLAGAAYQISQLKEKPLLVSHRPVSTLATRQEVTAKGLQVMLGSPIPRVSVWISRCGRKFVDSSQRMRSFLYMSLACGIAYQLRIQDVRYWENGVTTFNLPLDQQRIGSRSTRTTRPRVMKEFAEVCALVFGGAVNLTNPFVFRTKAEVIQVLKDAGVAELLGDAVSCSRTIRVHKETPHCGACLQCIVRRFAVIASGTEEFDPVSHYAKDIFVNQLEKGEEIANCLGWVRLNQKLEGMTPEQFFAEYPDLQDSFDAMDENAAMVGEAIFELFGGNAKQTRAAWEKQVAQNASKLYYGGVSADSLVNLVAQGSTKMEPIWQYAHRVMAVVERGLRNEYASRIPHKERELQQSMKAALAAAEEKLQKEYPTFSYSVGGAKPDFSDPEDTLYVEAKLLKEHSQKTALVDEIIADIEKYSSKCSGILFVIFQLGFIIQDFSDLAHPFEKHKHVFFKLIP